MTACPEPLWSPGTVVRGFRVLRVEGIPELRITAYEMIHERTGAQVLHLHGDDRENLFAIGFRTPPYDSTGLPHILEHSVLAGSERYPVKDAFNELHRGTLQTFINAFTYPDKTIYPVASQVKVDFYNLARVYMDLVLRPRLLPETFAQEGHHRELATAGDPASDLTVSGIVYNEMKGAYSSPDNLMFKAIQENLFPDTAYRFDAGGAPEVIPTLTYENFCAFHRAYYSPSNARIFLYGNIGPAEHLAFLEEALAGFDAVTVDSVIPPQPRWNAPRTVRRDLPVAKDEDPRRGAVVNIAWMLSENTEGMTSLLLQILANILVGCAAGPLRKALIDSRLGEDLSPVTGFERDYRQTVFVVGLRGTCEDRAQEIETLVLRTLAAIVDKGVDRDLIEATLHQVEFGGKEINRSAYPFGIALMGYVYHTWLYDGDPIGGLNFPALIAAVRKEWEANPRLFEGLIQTWLLENPHRLLSIMSPNPSFVEEQEARFRDDMARMGQDLTLDDKVRIDRAAADLKSFQAEGDPPEAIATLPRLRIEDMERQVETVPTTLTTMGDVPALSHDLFTNGIAYLDLVFDLSRIPEGLQPYVPLLAKFMTNLGAAGLDYEAMAKRLALVTGGLSCAPAAGLTAREAVPWQKLTFHIKALYRNIPDALALLGDILCSGDLTDLKRQTDLLAEKKNALQAAVVPSGHLFAQRLAAASLSLPAWRNEQWRGKTQLQFLEGLSSRFKADGSGTQETLQRIKDAVLHRGGLLVNLTADGEGLVRLEEETAHLIARLPARGEETPAAATPPAGHPSRYRHPGSGLLCGPGLWCPRLLPQVDRRTPGPDEVSVQRLSLQDHPGPGRGLWRHVPVRPDRWRFCLPVLSGPPISSEP